MKSMLCASVLALSMAVEPNVQGGAWGRDCAPIIHGESAIVGFQAVRRTYTDSTISDVRTTYEPEVGTGCANAANFQPAVCCGDDVRVRSEVHSMNYTIVGGDSSPDELLMKTTTSAYSLTLWNNQSLEAVDKCCNNTDAAQPDSSWAVLGQAINLATFKGLTCDDECFPLDEILTPQYGREKITQRHLQNPRPPLPTITCKLDVATTKGSQAGGLTAPYSPYNVELWNEQDPLRCHWIQVEDKSHWTVLLIAVVIVLPFLLAVSMAYWFFFKKKPKEYTEEEGDVEMQDQPNPAGTGTAVVMAPQQREQM